MAQPQAITVRPAHGRPTATATVVRRGRSAVVDVTVSDASGSPTAVVRQIVAVRAAPDATGAL